jgi:peptidoglycan/LPS O-acetylase OafA/YrhL
LRPAPQPRASPRFDGIDVLRGLSIGAVILLHINIHMAFAGHRVQTLLPRPVYHLLFLNGGNGVTVFFAVSGFLITFTSIRRFGSLAVMRPAIFYRIRFARIAPLLLLLLTVLSVLDLAHVPGFEISSKVATLPQALFAALTFHINYLEAHARAYLPANWDVLWSLSVEEMFYLFFPLLCVLILRFRHGKCLFLGVLLGFVALGPYARAVLARGNPIWGDSSYLGGMDSIALGCLCALLTNYLLERRSTGCPVDKPGFPIQAASSREWGHAGHGWDPITTILQFVGSALILWIAFWPRWPIMRFLGRTALDGALLPIGVCCVMLATVLRGSHGSRWTTPLRWAGRHSYELYLTHSFFVVTAAQLNQKLHSSSVRAPFMPPPLLQCVLWTAAILMASALLAYLLARSFTEPLNRRLRPSGVQPDQQYRSPG